MRLRVGIGNKRTSFSCQNKRMPHNRWDAVIFDYGRVLSQSPTARDLREFAALAGTDEPPFFEVYSNTRQEYDCGRQTCQQHWQCFADAAGVRLSPAQIDRILALEHRMWLRVNSGVLDLARDLRAAGLRTAILSNMPFDLLSELRRELSWLNEFDVQIWSCELGATKPDPAIYQACLQALGCEPQRALFFDDRLGNVEGACKLGIDGRLFESAEQAREIVRTELETAAIAAHQNLES
jgi:putative hydrolase of the HAD superfamily